LRKRSAPVLTSNPRWNEFDSSTVFAYTATGVFQQPVKPGPFTAIGWRVPACHARARLPAGAHVLASCIFCEGHDLKPALSCLSPERSRRESRRVPSSPLFLSFRIGFSPARACPERSRRKSAFRSFSAASSAGPVTFLKTCHPRPEQDHSRSG